MDRNAFETRVTNSQLVGLHVAAAVFVVIGIGAESAAGNPAPHANDIAETFDSALMDPVWIVMHEAPGSERAECFSPTQVKQTGGMLRITAEHTDGCADGTDDAVVSGFVQAGVPLPIFGHLHTEFVAPTAHGTPTAHGAHGAEPLVALAHPDGAERAAVSLSGNEATVQLDGAVRARAVLTPSISGAVRAFDARITDAGVGVRFELSLDGKVILDHTESDSLGWRSDGGDEAGWLLQIALGADESTDLPQTFAIDSVSHTGFGLSPQQEREG